MSNPFSDPPNQFPPNPYAAPTQGYGQPGYNQQGEPPFDARGKLFPPALILTILGSLDFLVRVLNLLLMLMGFGIDAERQSPVAQLTVATISALMSGILLYGATCMLRMTDLRSAHIAAILACIPICSSCLVLGIPFGIWSLVVLNDNRVQAAFDQK